MKLTFQVKISVKNIVICYYLNCPSFDFIGSSREKILESQSFVSLDNDFFQNTVKKIVQINGMSSKRGFTTYAARSGKDKNV